MESRASKRKRCGDIRNSLADELHNLTLTSFQFNEDLESASDDFVLMFKSMGDRQSEMYARSIGLDEKYGELIGLIKGDDLIHVGQTSSYCTDIRKFLDDTSSSLDAHSKGFAAKIDEMIKEVEEHSAVWKGKLMEMKRQAQHIVSQRRQLAVEMQEFKKNI